MERVLFAKRHKRLGLIGSRERVEMVGGKFGIESAPGHGTTISAEIPISGAGPKGTPKTLRKSHAVSKP
jgi:signal transduction histidine kinase